MGLAATSARRYVNPEQDVFILCFITPHSLCQQHPTLGFRFTLHIVFQPPSLQRPRGGLISFFVSHSESDTTQFGKTNNLRGIREPAAWQVCRFIPIRGEIMFVDMRSSFTLPPGGMEWEDWVGRMDFVSPQPSKIATCSLFFTHRFPSLHSKEKIGLKTKLLPSI